MSLDGAVWNVLARSPLPCASLEIGHKTSLLTFCYCKLSTVGGVLGRVLLLTAQTLYRDSTAHQARSLRSPILHRRILRTAHVNSCYR